MIGASSIRRQRRLIRYYEVRRWRTACGAHTTQFAIRKPEIGLFDGSERGVEEINSVEKRGELIIRHRRRFGPTEQVIRCRAGARDGLRHDVAEPGGLPADADEEAYVARIRALRRSS